MSKLKKFAVILAVVFVSSVVAGAILFDAVAEMTQETLEANNEEM